MRVNFLTILAVSENAPKSAQAQAQTAFQPLGTALEMKVGSNPEPSRVWQVITEVQYEKRNKRSEFSNGRC